MSAIYGLLKIFIQVIIQIHHQYYDDLTFSHFVQTAAVYQCAETAFLKAFLGNLVPILKLTAA